MPSFDAIVIGSGVIGSSAALHLAAHGRTLLLERFEFLHERGSSHGGSRIFRHAYPDAAHVRLAQAAERAWTDLETFTNERLLVRTGGLDFVNAGSAVGTAIKNALAQAGSEYESLSPEEVRERFPAFAPDGDTEAVYQPNAGITPASRAVATLQRAAAASGAVLREREVATAVRATSAGVEVITDKGNYSAASVVVAAGPWLGKLLPELELRLQVIKQQVLYMRIRDGAREFAPYRMPVFIDHRQREGGSIYGFALFELPHAIKVGDHGGAQATDPDGRDFLLDEEWATRTARTAQLLMPGLTGEVVSGTTCLYTKSADEVFIVDRHPASERVVLAGAGSGHAFKFGPVLGEAAASLALGSESPHDIGPFSLRRFA